MKLLIVIFAVFGFVFARPQIQFPGNEIIRQFASEN